MKLRSPLQFSDGSSTISIVSTDLVLNSASGTVLVDDNLRISGYFDAESVREIVTDSTITTSVLTSDFLVGSISFQATAPSSNFTINITNAPTDNGRAITATVFVTQGATGYIPNAVQVGGSAVSALKWAGGSAPTPTSSAGKIDIFSFVLVRRGSAWTAFGSATLNY